MKKQIIFIAGLMMFKGLVFSQSVKPVNLNEFDSSIKPGNDFFAYVNGKWMAETAVPPSKVAWGSFATLAEKASLDMKKLLEEAAKDPGKSRPYQLTGDFFISGMDSITIEKLGYTPIKKYLDEVDAAKDIPDINEAMASLRINGIANPLYFFSVEIDAKKTTQYVPFISQGGLGMPDKSYYFKTDPRTTKIRDEYRLYITDMFKLIGTDTATAARNASLIIDLETTLASRHLSKVELRDAEKTYNKLNIADLHNNNINWKKLFTELHVGRDNFIADNPAFLHFADSLLATVPISTWKLYLKWNILYSSAPYLSMDFVNRRFIFRKTLSGQKELSPRWQRTFYIIDNNLGDALGKLYVSNYFKPEAKQRMMSLVNNLQQAFGERIKKLSWMSDETKKKALIKLAAISKKIAYPEKWKDYTGVIISKDRFFENILSCTRWNLNYAINKLKAPADKNEWHTTPQTVNAYYSSTYNDISFPAVILQPPFFYFTADDAVNYGAIGSIIGHEMTHGFDDQGRKFNADGNLEDWWTSNDSAKFMTEANKLEKEFDAFIVLDSIHVNGKLTLGENIADLGGLEIAYEAFKKTPQGKSVQKIDGLTPDQRFFISYAIYRRLKVVPEFLAQLINTDPHSPDLFRVNGAVTNIDAFYKAFDVKPGDKLYKPENERIKIW